MQLKPTKGCEAERERERYYKGILEFMSFETFVEVEF